MQSGEFKVSVIIPVYNAEKYLIKAVESAVKLSEVSEIILVEDKSPDNALEVAFHLQHMYPNVHVYQHPDKGNHGAGASRNLGIKKATSNYIAFLDADDYYLPNRFKKDKKVFETFNDCDGVYNSVATHFYSEEAKKSFFENGLGYQEILTLTDTVTPDELFSVLFNQHSKVKGQFCTDGITLKKEVFEKAGYFNTDLKLRQDIHLWRRLTAFCNLYAGEITKPVAMRGIHENNRMTRKKDHEQYLDLWWKSLKTEFAEKRLVSSKKMIFDQAYFNHYSDSSNKVLALKSFISNVINYPRILKDSNSYFDFNFWKVFGRNWFTLKVISFKNKIFNK